MDAKLAARVGAVGAAPASAVVELAVTSLPRSAAIRYHDQVLMATPCPATSFIMLDSTALLLLAARWRKSLKRGPKLVAVTVDHGLRPEAKREAAAVKKLARSLGVEHRTMRWTGRKPSTGLQQAARNARYGLLAAAAKSAGARHILTAHTMDDQAETVLIRLARGSGVSGLAAMARNAPLPTNLAAEDRQIIVRGIVVSSSDHCSSCRRTA